MERPNLDDDDDFQQFYVKPRTAGRAECSAVLNGRRMKSVKSQENPFTSGDSPTLRAPTRPAAPARGSSSRGSGGDSTPANSDRTGAESATDAAADCCAAAETTVAPPIKRRRIAAACTWSPPHGGQADATDGQLLTQQHRLAGPTVERRLSRPADCSKRPPPIQAVGRRSPPPQGGCPHSPPPQSSCHHSPPSGAQAVPAAPDVPAPLLGPANRRRRVISRPGPAVEHKEEGPMSAVCTAIEASEEPSGTDCVVLERTSDDQLVEPSRCQQITLIETPHEKDLPIKSASVAKIDTKQLQKTKNSKHFDCPMCGRTYKIEKFQIAHTAKCVPKVAIDNVGALVKKLEKRAGSGAMSSTRRSRSLVDAGSGALLSVKSTAPERFTKSVKLNTMKKCLVGPAGRSVEAGDAENKLHVSAEERSSRSSEAGSTSKMAHKVTRPRRKSSVKAAGNSAEDRPLLLQLEPAVVRQLLEARLHELLSSTGRCSQATFTPALLPRSRPSSLRLQSAAAAAAPGNSEAEIVAVRQPRLWDLATMYRADLSRSIPCNAENSDPESRTSGTLTFSGYYVRSLMPPLSPCKVKAGSKLREWSSIPGRKEEIIIEAEASIRSPTNVLDRSQDGDGAASTARDDETHDRLAAELLSITPEGYEHMVGSSVGSDMHVLAADGEIPCHSFIMASKYPGLLRTVAVNRCLSLKDVGKQDVLKWLTFLYTGKRDIARSLSPATLAVILNVIRASTDATDPGQARSDGDLCLPPKSHPEPPAAAFIGNVTSGAADEVPATEQSSVNSALPKVLSASHLVSAQEDDLVALGLGASVSPELDLEATPPPPPVNQCLARLGGSQLNDRLSSTNYPVATPSATVAGAAITSVAVATPLVSCSVVAPLTSSPFTPSSVESQLPSPQFIPVIDVGRSPESALISDDDSCCGSVSPKVQNFTAKAPAEPADDLLRIMQDVPGGLANRCWTTLPAAVAKSSQLPAAHRAIDNCQPLPVNLPLASTPHSTDGHSNLPSTPASRWTQLPRKACSRLLQFTGDNGAGALPSPVRSVERCRRDNDGETAADCANSRRSPDVRSMAEQYSLSLIGSPSSSAAARLHVTSVAALSTTATRSMAVEEPRVSEVGLPAACSPVVIDSDWSAEAFISSPEPSPNSSPRHVQQVSGSASCPISVVPSEHLVQSEYLSEQSRAVRASAADGSLSLHGSTDSHPSKPAQVSNADQRSSFLPVSAHPSAMHAVASTGVSSRAASPVIDLTQASPAEAGFDSDCCFPLDDESDLDILPFVLSDVRPPCEAMKLSSGQVTDYAEACCTSGGADNRDRGSTSPHANVAASEGTNSFQTPIPVAVLSELPLSPNRPAAGHPELPLADTAAQYSHSLSQSASVPPDDYPYPVDNDMDFDDSFVLDDADKLVSEPVRAEHGSDTVPALPPLPAARAAPGAAAASATPAQVKGRHAPTVPSPFTPMPAYSAMDTPQLKREVCRFGVKPQLSKKRMVALLHDIYRQTHQYETDTSAELSTLESDANVGSCVERERAATAASAAAVAAAITDVHRLPILPSVPRIGDIGTTSTIAVSSPVAVAQPAASTLVLPSSPSADNSQDESGSDYSSDLDDNGEGSADEVIEESYMPEDAAHPHHARASSSAAVGYWEEPEPECSQKVSTADLERHLLAYFTTNDQLYRRVLLYEPLDFDELLTSIKSHGIRCSAAKLVNFCDDKCITYTMRKRSRTQDGKPTSRHRRKPGGKKRA